MDIRLVVGRFTFRAEVLMALPPHSQGYRQRTDSFLQRLAEEQGVNYRPRQRKQISPTYLSQRLMGCFEFTQYAGALRIVLRNIPGLMRKDDTASRSPRNGPH